MTRKQGGKLKSISAVTRIEVSFIEECVEHGVLAQFSAPELARVRRLRRLCRDLDVDVFAGSIIVELLERTESLRQELDRLKRS